MAQVHPSRFSGNRLQLLTKGADEKPPKLDRITEAMLIRLAQLEGWRLNRARRKKNDSDSLAKRMRLDILAKFPPNLYGIVARGKKRNIQLILARRTIKSIRDNGAFISYLGPYASEVVEAISVPMAAIITDPDNYGRFVKMMKKNFGIDNASELVLKIDTERLNELVEVGLLEARNDFFEEGEGPIRVYVKLV